MPPADKTKHPFFDLTVNLGNVLTALAMLAAGFTWGSAMDRRVAVLEEKAQVLKERDSQQDSQTHASVILLRSEFAELKTEIRETNRRLERLLDSMKK